MDGPARIAQSVEHFHGKEGVVGSSPTEGFPRICRGNGGGGGGVSIDLWWIRGSKESRLNEGQRARAFEAAQAAGVVLIKPPRLAAAA